jgi:hypothetical protein
LTCRAERRDDRGSGSIRKESNVASAAETRMLPARTWERYEPLAGVLAVVGWVLGVLILGDISDKDKGPEILAEYQLHDGRILLGGVIWLLGSAFFLWFLGTLRARLRAAEGGFGGLAPLSFAAGVAAAVCLTLLPTADMAGALAEDDLDASAALAVHTVGTAFFFAAEYLCPVFLVATALVALRTRAVLPRWLAWVSLLVALVMVIAPIGWAALLFAFPIWVLLVSFLLWRLPAAARMHAAAGA